VCASDLTEYPSILLPESMPTAIGCLYLAEGSTLSLTQNTPLLQNGVALPDLIHRLALEGFVGIRGLPFLSTTGTNLMR
jgi:hypothetical protein